jgi:dihydropteroate synthase
MEKKTEITDLSLPKPGCVGRSFVVMGIVNVTPDSFSDGGKYFSTEQASDHACRLADQGAQVIDIGGQSTRPGAAEIDVTEECRRVIPVIRSIVKKTHALISVDTYNSETARRAVDAGALWINDVSAGMFDPAMPGFVASAGCKVILMHSRKRPGNMQENPSYNDVIAEVKEELRGRVGVFTKAGVKAGNIILDPGIGFAKRFEDNTMLLSRMREIVSMGYPVCLGVSRKSFIGQITGNAPDERLYGSLAALAPAFEAGVTVFRVHDVKETMQFLRVLDAVTERKIVL